MSSKPKPYRPTQEITDPDIRRFVIALCGKDKRGLRRSEDIYVKLAKTMKKEYLPFLSKFIESAPIVPKNVFYDGYVHMDVTIEAAHSGAELVRKGTTLTAFDATTFAHEIGHAVDGYFGWNNTFSHEVLLHDSRTLCETLVEELDQSGEAIYQRIISEYKEAIASALGQEAVDILWEHKGLYGELRSIPVNLEDRYTTAERQSIQDQLYECGFVETLYQVYQGGYFAEINRKYSPILDALSSRHDFSGQLLSHHKYDYYQEDPENVGMEFFANLFAMKVQDDGTIESMLKVYLPASLAAFEELFSLIMDHILGDKPFDDVRLRARIDKEGE